MGSDTALSEVLQARPHRGRRRPRACSLSEKVLHLLRERGPQNVLGSELYARPELYGRSPRNRISELRRHGHLMRQITWLR